MMSQNSNHTFGQSKHRSHSVSPLGANTVVTYWVQSLFNCAHSTVTFTFLFPPEYNSVDRRFLQSYFEKLQETMYSQGKGHVEEMNKICLFFIMCYEVCNGNNFFTGLPHILAISSVQQFTRLCSYVPAWWEYSPAPPCNHPLALYKFLVQWP